VLSARLRALARRDATVRRPLVPVGDVLLDPTHTRVIVRGERRPLTPREFALLDYLAQRAEQVVTRSELLDKVWSMQFDPGTNLIDVHVGRLRRKLRGAECVVIRTVRSLGYLLTTAPGGDVPSDAP
jgi:DNA-binding response OmpR family regulator